jgi:hypothetical protein
MRIRCLSNFKHGRSQYYQGDLITVPDSDGAYFVGLGWAADETGGTGTPNQGPTGLDIQNSTIGTGDTNG